MDARLRRRGIETTVFTTCHEKVGVTNDNVVGLRAIELPTGGYYLWPKIISPWALEMVRKADILHAFGISFFAPLAGLFWKSIVRIPSVLSAYYHPVDYTPHVLARRIYDWCTLGPIVNGYDKTIVHSRTEKRVLQRMIPSSCHQRIMTIENASSIMSVPHEYYGFREKYGGTDSVLVLCVGRVDFFKGFDDIVKAVTKLRARGLDLRLIHIGPTESWYNRPSLLDSSDKGFVRTLGHVPESVLASAYRECDVTLVPSQFEAFGLVAIESMLMGTPVIGTPTGIMPEIIRPGENGAIFQPGNVEDLTAKLESFVSGHPRVDSSQKRALISVEKYGNPEREVNDIIKLYSSLKQHGSL